MRKLSFFIGDLEKEKYITKLEGSDDDGKDQIVYQLKRSIYMNLNKVPTMVST